MPESGIFFEQAMSVGLHMRHSAPHGLSGGHEKSVRFHMHRTPGAGTEIQKITDGEGNEDPISSGLGTPRKSISISGQRPSKHELGNGD